VPIENWHSCGDLLPCSIQRKTGDGSRKRWRERLRRSDERDLATGDSKAPEQLTSITVLVRTSGRANSEQHHAGKHQKRDQTHDQWEYLDIGCAGQLSPETGNRATGTPEGSTCGDQSVCEGFVAISQAVVSDDSVRLETPGVHFAQCIRQSW